MDPGLVDLQLAEHVRHLVGVAAGPEVRRRALQHGDVVAVGGDGRHDGGGGGTGPDAQHLLALVVHLVAPLHRVDQQALVGVHVRPLGRVALVELVVALAHPQEVAGELEPLAAGRVGGRDRPLPVGLAPVRGVDVVRVADVLVEVVLVDHLAHVLQDLVGGGDGCAGPRLEAVPERVQVGVAADARVLVEEPGATEALHPLEDDERLLRALLLQVVGGADAGDAGADDDDVEVLGAHGCVGGKGGGLAHGDVPLVIGTWTRLSRRRSPRFRVGSP